MGRLDFYLSRGFSVSYTKSLTIMTVRIATERSWQEYSHDHGFMFLHTWMVDHGHFAVGLFDLEVRRGWLDAQDIVIRRVDHHDE